MNFIISNLPGLLILALLISGCSSVPEENSEKTGAVINGISDSDLPESEEDTLNENDFQKVENPKPVQPQKKVITSEEHGIDYLMGKIDPKSHPEFTEMTLEHCSKKGMYLRKDAYEAFRQMHAAAKKDGVNLRIISATRPFSRQKQIWEAKWSGARLVGGKDLSKSIPDPGQRALKILEYSSMPGTSRHHWGTDIDINNLENSYFKSGKGKIEYEWLVEHAPAFGYCQPYTEKDETRPNGYEEERWHWSYTPVSKKLTIAYKDRISEDMITGFEGSESAKIIGVIEKYVLGIHPDCLK